MADDDNFLARWSRRKAQIRQGVVPPPEPLATAPVVAPAAAAVLPSATVAGVPLPAAEAPLVAADTGPAEKRPPPPTLEDVALLDRESSFSRFVAPDVPPEVKNAALRKLFTDPHFNVMDGLDTYIDDYGQPDPLPASMLRQMASAHALGLFRDDTVPGPNAPRAAGSQLDPPATATDTAAAGEDPAKAVDDAAARHAASTLPDAPEPGAADPAQPPAEPAHEDTDLRLQPNDAAGCPGAEPGAGEDARRQH